MSEVPATGDWYAALNEFVVWLRADILFFWVARMSMLCTHFTGVPPFKEVYVGKAGVLDELFSEGHFVACAQLPASCGSRQVWKENVEVSRQRH